MFFFRVIALALLLSSFAFAQDLTRAEKIEKINDLRSQIGALEKDIMMPDARDSALAARIGVNVIRLLPREKYDGILATRGGGSYYSFHRKNQEYGRGSDVGLERGHISVGFAGADYGFIFDLGKTQLADVSLESKEASFLVSYKPPVNLPDVRKEQYKAHKFEVDGVTYQNRLPYVVENTYLLRSISFDRSDILVAFTVYRKDPDGSLILLWKMIENFEPPKLVQSEVAEK